MLKSAKYIVSINRHSSDLASFFSNKFECKQFFILINDLKKSKWPLVESDLNYIRFSDLESLNVEVDKIYRNEKIIEKILNDTTAFLLAERFSGGPSLRSGMLFSYRTTSIVLKSIEYLQEIEPIAVIFQSYPHHLHTWIFCRVAEQLGVKVFILSDTPLPWKKRVKLGLHSDSFLDCRIENDYPTCSNDALRIVKQKSQDYSSAVPWYMAAQVASSGKATRHLRRIIVELLSRLRITKRENAINSVEMLQEALKSLETKLSPSEKSITFFLQYQPERTTLPQAGVYVDQLYAIQTLRSGMPKDWKLFVKEHPSTFLLNSPIRVRSDGFYRMIASLPNTYILPVDSDPFEVIDSSSAIATITGSVAFEALCRKKEVISFGVNPAHGCRGLYRVNSVSSVKSAIDRIINQKSTLQIEDIESYLCVVEQQSLPKGSKLYSNHQQAEISSAALRELIAEHL